MSYQIRPSVHTDLAQIAALISSQNSEPTTLEDMERSERLRNPNFPFYRLVAVSEQGALLGTGSASHGPEHPDGIFFARVRVWKQHEGQGIGQALYAMLETWVREQGGTVIESTVKDDEEHAIGWTRRRDFKPKQHLFESTLSLTDWDSAPFTGSVTQAEAAGFHFTTLAQEGEIEALLPRFYAFTSELVRDIPGLEDRPPFPYEEWLKWVKNDPHWDPKLVYLVKDGDRWAGFSHVSQQNSGAYYNSTTAIGREYRGKGLSLAVKVLTLLKLKELGAPSIRTNNDSTNSRMLATNRRLGYTPLPGFYVISKKL